MGLTHWQEEALLALLNPTGTPVVSPPVDVSGLQPKIKPGTTRDYFRGDETMQPLDTSAVPEGPKNLYFTNGRAQVALGLPQTTDYLPKFTATNKLTKAPLWDDVANTTLRATEQMAVAFGIRLKSAVATFLRSELDTSVTVQSFGITASTVGVQTTNVNYAFDDNFYPTQDNVATCGTNLDRWKTFYGYSLDLKASATIVGPLGVGASAPTHPLHIASSGGVQARFQQTGGTQAAIQIDSANSLWQAYIPSGGTDLRFWNGQDVLVLKASGSSKVALPGLPIYANNAAAVAGGLSAGALYRTGADPDPICVVH